MFSSEKSLDIFLKLIDLESVFGPYSNLTVIITPLIRTLKFWNGKMTLVCGHIVTVSTTNVRFIYVFVICTENKHRIVDSKSIADRDCLTPIWGISGTSGSVISGQKIQSHFIGFDDVIPD